MLAATSGQRIDKRQGALVHTLGRMYHPAYDSSDADMSRPVNGFCNGDACSLLYAGIWKSVKRSPLLLDQLPLTVRLLQVPAIFLHTSASESALRRSLGGLVKNYINDCQRLLCRKWQRKSRLAGYAGAT